jgi:integrase
LTAKWGEWFGSYKRSLGVDPRMVFHSFRHTFKDKARGRVSEGVQRQIMGHSSADVADNYGSGFDLWQLVEEMRRYKVPGLKLPPRPPAFRDAEVSGT